MPENNPIAEASSDACSTLLDAYNGLPLDLRIFMQILAVHGKPIDLYDLSMLLKAIGMIGSEYLEDFSGYMEDYLTERRIGIRPFPPASLNLCILKWSTIQCNKAIIMQLVNEARSTGVLKRAVRQIQIYFPRDRGYRDQQTLLLHRDIRFALMLREESTFYELIRWMDGNYFNPGSKELLEVLVDFRDDYSAFSLPIRYAIFYSVLTDCNLKLADSSRHYNEMERSFAEIDHPVVLGGRGFMALFRGLPDLAETLLEQIRPQSVLDEQTLFGLMASLRFMQGRNSEALSAFVEYIARLKRTMRKRKLYLDGTIGWLHLYALLRDGSEASMKQIREIVNHFEPLTDTGDFWHTVQAFSIYLDYIDLKLNQERATTLLSGLLLGVGPHSILAILLIMHWARIKPIDKHRKQLLSHYSMALEHGHLWYAFQAGHLLNATAGKTAEDLSDMPSLDMEPLVDLHYATEKWERVLTAMETLALPVNNDAGEERLVWDLIEVTENGYKLQPKVQKKLKNGSWSKGRNASIQRLATESDSLPWISRHDLPICRNIRQSSEYNWYINNYQIIYPDALIAAIGHPGILFNGDPIEVVAGNPAILVQQVKRTINIELQPPAPASGQFSMLREGKRLVIYQYTPQQLEIGRLLGNGMQIPAKGKERLVETIASVAPMVTIHSDIGDIGVPSAAVEKVEADPQLYLQLQPHRDGLRIQCETRPLGLMGPSCLPGQGAASIFCELDGRRLHAQRDLASEQAVVDRLLTKAPILDPELHDWTLDDPEEALDVLDAIELIGDGLVIEWPQGKPVRLARSKGISAMEFRVGKKNDWFEISGSLALDDGRVIDMARLLELMEQTKSRFVPLSNDEFLNLGWELRRRLDAIRAIEDRGRVHPLAAPLIDDILESAKTTSDRAWRAQKRLLQEAGKLRPEVPSTLQAALRDYQLEGFHWLAQLAHWGGGACLADDMGLGKTVQTLALLLHRAADGPALVIAPTSVCANWIEESLRFAPTLNTIQFGPGDRKEQIEGVGPFDLVVCSYGLLQNESELLTTIYWRTIVADEAQAFKNARTKRSKAVMALSGEFRMITTGTPIENHLGELWNLFRFINPGLLGSMERFNQRLAIPIEQQEDSDARQRLKRVIRPFILRRLKSEVLNELPEKTEITIHIELSEEEQIFYEALRQNALERIEDNSGVGSGDTRLRILAEIMRMRRACCHSRLVMPESALESSKLKTFAAIVEELRQSNHKALVFSQFVDHLAIVREWCDQQQIDYQYLDGSTPATMRQRAVKQFQRGEGDLFLISLKAGGAGLNLTAADYVIHLDPWWNPAVEDQASARAHRMGQKRPVTIYRLVTKDTIEDRIIGLHREKRDLADALLDGTGSASRMGIEEMISLLHENY